MRQGAYLALDWRLGADSALPIGPFAVVQEYRCASS